MSSQRNFLYTGRKIKGSEALFRLICPKTIDSPRKQCISFPLVTLQCCCLPVYTIDEIPAIFFKLGDWHAAKTRVYYVFPLWRNIEDMFFQDVETIIIIIIIIIIIVSIWSDKMLEENCELWGTKNVQGQISACWGKYLKVIIWLAPRAGKMNQILRCDWLPERARWSHLARSGLPALSRKTNFPKSHIINPLLTKLVRSWWLDISLVLFLRVYGPRLRLGP